MTKPTSILIIEDDAAVRLTLTAYLEDSGYLVFEAADGVEGMEVFRRERPAVVVTDLRMPRLDGRGVIALLKLESPGTPVLVITGTGTEDAHKEAVQLGARGCLKKPIDDLAVLVAKIEEIVGE